jgi:hypothetical protein
MKGTGNSKTETRKYNNRGEILEEANTILEYLIKVMNQTFENNNMLIIIEISVKAWKNFLS